MPGRAQGGSHEPEEDTSQRRRVRRGRWACSSLTAVGALAQGPPVAKETQRLVSETSTTIDAHPCTGQPAELTVTQSGVIGMRLGAP